MNRIDTGIKTCLIVLLLINIAVSLASAQKMAPGQHRYLDPGVAETQDLWRIGDMGCPMMSDYASSVSRVLVRRYEIDLSPAQEDELKKIRDHYQQDAIDLYSRLQTAIYRLENYLTEENIEMDRVREINNEIEHVQSELRSRNIEVFLQTREVLSQEQIEELRRLGLWE